MRGHSLEGFVNQNKEGTQSMTFLEAENRHFGTIFQKYFPSELEKVSNTKKLAYNSKNTLKFFYNFLTSGAVGFEVFGGPQSAHLTHSIGSRFPSTFSTLPHIHTHSSSSSITKTCNFHAFYHHLSHFHLSLTP